MGRHWKFSAVFLALAAALFWLGAKQGGGIVTVVCFSAAAGFLGLSLSYLLSWPGLLGKARNGRLLGSSYLLFWPYHLHGYLALVASRLVLREPPFNEIVPGLFLGSRLLPGDGKFLATARLAGVLDLTSEFCETAFLRHAGAYLCIPLLDRTAPGAAELRKGVEFIRERLKRGPVYVHCAQGHGRSTTFVVAYLVASGQAASLEAAFELARSKRPRVRLSSSQWRALREFFSHE
jgi:hypothetical protein